MGVPARWRFVREDDHLRSWQCDGDGVDLCRAPATWVAEHEHEGVLKVVAQRCPDHIPVRACASTLPAPPVPHRDEGAPAVEPFAPLPETALPETIETPVAIPVPATAMKDVETEPALADTQPAVKFASPAPPSSSSTNDDEDKSAPPDAIDRPRGDEDEP